MQDSKNKSTLFNIGLVLSVDFGPKIHEEIIAMKHICYSKIVGSFMHVIHQLKIRWMFFN
jgi:hypothetical protein